MPLAVGSWAREVLLCVGLLACLFVLAFGGEHDGVNIWPMPKSASHGSQMLFLSKDFVLSTQGSKYGDGSELLKEAFDRMIDVVEVNHIVDGRTPTSSVLAGLNVVILSPQDQLNFGIDESYKLDVPAAGKHMYARIEAQTVYGALHALQTFSQLCHFNIYKRIVELQLAPWYILDQPRFPYRGLLIDTSRHYLPLPIIKGVIDSMAYSKLNVVHWHIVDKQSFPLEIPSYPRLWAGAYSYSERDTKADALEIAQHAERRGVNVLAEIDVPGHALSWGVGYPDLWPSAECQEPLDVSKEFTFKVIEGILSDFTKVFKFRFVHLGGGDEVNTSKLIHFLLSVIAPHLFMPQHVLFSHHGQWWANLKLLETTETIKYYFTDLTFFLGHFLTFDLYKVTFHVFLSDFVFLPFMFHLMSHTNSKRWL